MTEQERSPFARAVAAEAQRMDKLEAELGQEREVRKATESRVQELEGEGVEERERAERWKATAQRSASECDKLEARVDVAEAEVERLRRLAEDRRKMWKDQRERAQRAEAKLREMGGLP